MHRSMRQRGGCTAALLLALLASCACTLLSSRTALAADDAIAMGKLGLFQEYRVSISGLQNSFEYEIVPTEDDAPLPVDASGATVKQFSLKRDQQLWLTFKVPAPVSPSAEQLVYHYKLQPKKTKLTGGLYYVDLLDKNLKAGINVYYLELYVQLASTEAGDAVVTPVVHVEAWDGPKVTDPGWRVAYDKKAAEKTRRSTSGGSSRARTPLSRTGDTYNAALVTGCVAYGIALVLAGVLLRRRRAGECDA